jgi:bacterioferritin (cytochrome b1)
MKAILKDEENHLKEMETFIEKINKLFEKQATEQNK